MKTVLWNFTQFFVMIERATPIISGPQLINITVGIPFYTTYSSTDADGLPIVLNITGLPEGARFNQTTGVLSWTAKTITEVPSLR